MADDRYYSNADEGQRFQPGTTVEAGQVDGKLDEITAGFQQVAADTDRSLKLPGVTGTSQELDATPLQRRRKVVGFDADGSLALLDGFTWRGTWTATTEYFVNDVIVEPATLNWYVARVRHVSDVTFATTNWNLGLDYAAVKALLRTDVGVLLEEDLQPLVGSASGSAQAAGTSAGEALEYRNQAATIRDQTQAISESGLPAQTDKTGMSLMTTGAATYWGSPLPDKAGNENKALFASDDGLSEEWREIPPSLKIGDVLITERAPGAEFVRTNAIYLQSAYPELFGVVGIRSNSTQWSPGGLPVGTQWTSVTFGNGTFVAVSGQATGNAAASSDGISWVRNDLPYTSYWNGVAFGNGVFVAVAGSNNYYTARSTDGASWTAGMSSTAADWKAITFGNGVFVAVAGNSTIVATSPDGISWTQSTLPFTADWRGIAYGAGVFVAVSGGSQQNAAMSADGINWTAVDLGHTGSWQSITFGNDLFLAITGDVVVTSPDGINWTKGNLPFSASWQDITFGDGLFVAIAANRETSLVSRDAYFWSTVSMGYSTNWRTITYGDGKFLAVAYGSTSAYRLPFATYDTATQFFIPSVDTGGGLPAYIKASEVV